MKMLELAKALGISPSMVSHILHGKRKIQRNALGKLLYNRGVTVARTTRERDTQDGKQPPEISTAQSGVIEGLEYALSYIKDVVADMKSEIEQATRDGNIEKIQKSTEKWKQVESFEEKIDELENEWTKTFTKVARRKNRKRGKKATTHLKHRLLTPEVEFREPILRAVLKLGGFAIAQEVLKEVEKTMSQILKPIDRQSIKSQPKRPHWRNTAYNARGKLVIEGLLSDSTKGVWAITEKGKQWLNDNETKHDAMQ